MKAQVTVKVILVLSIHVSKCK